MVKVVKMPNKNMEGHMSSKDMLIAIKKKKEKESQRGEEERSGEEEEEAGRGK